MPGFRSRPNIGRLAAELSSELVREIITDVMAPAHFFASPTLKPEWQVGVREEIPWELFQGRLLDPGHTRLQRSFESWNVHRDSDGGRSAQPLLAVKFDQANGVIYVARGILCQVVEGYDGGNNVFLSRETRKWIRELVATLPLDQFPTAADLRDELLCRILQAVVGTSRLPLTSVEAPLPEFSLGELAYCFHSDLQLGERAVPSQLPGEFMHDTWRGDLAGIERIKLLETLLRATPADQLAEAARLWLKRLRTVGSAEQSIPLLLRGLFEEVALSPYTDFVPKTLTFVQLVVDQGGLTIEEHVDFLSYLLRQLGRHLTAYDLVRFHHRGANYPDALLLDEALKEYLRLCAGHANLFRPAAGDTAMQGNRKRLRRRALRQGYYWRRHYEGHLVPDRPTSPGENARVLAPPHVRIPDEQIVDPSRRTRKLFVNDPLDGVWQPEGRAILEQSFLDLEHPSELLELGMALYLDRPLGVFKAPLEPDQTLLLSYEMFSRSLAERRLHDLTVRWGDAIKPGTVEKWQESIRELAVEGAAPEIAPGRPRPGGVSLSDALQVAADFIVLRTTRKSVREFFALFDFSELASRFGLEFLTESRLLLILRGSVGPEGKEGRLRILDETMRPRVELQISPEDGYASRGGWEYPAGGLKVLRIRQADGVEEDAQKLDLKIGIKSW
jgi:hypothetical protein